MLGLRRNEARRTRILIVRKRYQLVATVRGLGHAAAMTKSAVARQLDSRGRLSLNPPGLFPLVLTRLFDHEVSALSPWCRAIETDSLAAFSRNVMQHEMTLPRVFIAAERIFGRSSTRFDSYKGSFQFALLMSANHARAEARYVIVLHDVRGSVRITYHRFSEECGAQQRKLTDGELSRSEVDRLAETLLEFLSIAGDAVARTTSCFHRAVPSERLVYGCRKGVLFASQFESIDEYEGGLERIRVDVADGEHRVELDYVRGLLQAISDAPQGA